MKIFMTTLGLARILNGLDLMSKAAPVELNNVLKDAATKVYERSQELVPVDTGFLKASGYVREVSKHEWEVGYDADYAVYVHERYARHQEPTTWKYLELAYLELDASFDGKLRSLDLTRGLGFRLS